jgi:prolyl 3-hydroxylase /prolyl 3,4-dihydroxylase
MGRSRSASVSGGSAPKKLKTSHPSATDADAIAKASFHPPILDAENIEKLHDEYVNNTPWKHSVVDKLFNDDLLEKVKDECIGELSFTEKETDIYKVRVSAR